MDANAPPAFSEIERDGAAETAACTGHKSARGSLFLSHVVFGGVAPFDGESASDL
jgi:hypothetical protein